MRAVKQRGSLCITPPCLSFPCLSTLLKLTHLSFYRAFPCCLSHSVDQFQVCVYFYSPVVFSPFLSRFLSFLPRLLIIFLLTLFLPAFSMFFLLIFYLQFSHLITLPFLSASFTLYLSSILLFLPAFFTPYLSFSFCLLLTCTFFHLLPSLSILSCSLYISLTFSFCSLPLLSMSPNSPRILL